VRVTSTLAVADMPSSVCALLGTKSLSGTAKSDAADQES
jgi:hypothetical protein